MKRIPIKFRGADIISGEYHYGDYVTRSEGCAIRVRENDKLFDMHEYEIAVKPESVAQLVGCDANGAEVYEGDKIQDLATGDVTTAKLCPCNSYDVGIITVYFEKVGNNND